MNKLSATDRARILHLLCEGNSIRAVVRLTGASKNTIAKLLVDAGKACHTSYVERQNLTMRLHMRRLTRLTNGFSKEVGHHAYAAALHFMYYNFVRLHGKLRVTPAMAAGVTDRLWEIGDIVALVEAADVQPNKRGLYGKHKVH